MWRSIVWLLVVMGLLGASGTSLLARNMWNIRVVRSLYLADDQGLCPSVRRSGLPGEIPSAEWIREAESSGDGRVQANLGVYWLASGDPRRSESALRKSLLIRSEVSPLVHFWLGCATLASGDESGAVTEWRAANGEAYFLSRGDRLFFLQQYAQALNMYDMATRITPDSAEGWLRVAAAQMNLASMGQATWESTLFSAKRSLALAPNDPQAHYLAGYALWLSGADSVRAESELRWALTRRQYWGDAYALGRMLLDRGVSGEPTDLMLRALALFNDDEIRAQLIRAYLAEGRLSEARDAYRQALEINPAQHERLQLICKPYGVHICDEP